MAQVNAGDVVTITINGQQLTIKIEDASKSESILARVETGETATYHAGQVYEFSRAVLKDSA